MSKVKDIDKVRLNLKQILDDLEMGIDIKTIPNEIRDIANWVDRLIIDAMILEN